MMINNGMPNILQLPYSFQVIKLGCFLPLEWLGLSSLY